MGDKSLRITMLGARGSVPVSGSQFDKFGGATTCYMIEEDDQVIFLDGGSGIVNAPDIDPEKEVSVLLTHLHLDHVLGLPFFPELTKPGRKITLYGENKNKKTVSMELDELFSSSFWPLKLFEYPADLTCREIKMKFSLGDVLVECIQLNHPGGSLGFSLKSKGKKIVVLSDHEYSKRTDIYSFSKGADLILFDAQYTDEEYESHRGFGHSSIGMAIDFAEKVKAKKMLIIHHDPHHEDDFLNNIQEGLYGKNIFLARQGEILEV